MATQTKLQVIDADAHVVETERTWDYLEPAEAKYRPHLYYTADDPTKRYWVIDEKIRGLNLPTLAEKELRELSQRSGRSVESPRAAREMDDVELRLKHLDQLGIDIQVLHNTLWIEQVTDRVEVEVALCKSWNRWLADIWKQGNGRLRWSCVLPLLAIDEALAQLRAARDNGAVAVCMRPVEGNRLLVDPYFYPIYEEASRLDMAVAVHIANGNAAMVDVLKTPYTRSLGFGVFRTPTVAACQGIMTSDIPQLFPTLRWGFIEASAQWVPWVLHEATRRDRSLGRAVPENILREYRIYVTCESDDDLPYILQHAGEDNIVIGTDYGHTDTSSEMDAMEVLKQRNDINQAAKNKILHHNPRALYGL